MTQAARIARILLGVVFVGLLITPLAMKRMSGTARRASTAADWRRDCVGSPRILSCRKFRQAAGINFVHQSPALDPNLIRSCRRLRRWVRRVDRRFRSRRLVRHLRHQQRHGSKNALYRNLGDGTFKDVAAELGIADVNQTGTGVSTGAVWGDYDNDGYEDLFLY